MSVSRGLGDPEFKEHNYVICDPEVNTTQLQVRSDQIRSEGAMRVGAVWGMRATAPCSAAHLHARLSIGWPSWLWERGAAGCVATPGACWQPGLKPCHQWY